MPFYGDEIVDRVREASDIVDIVGSYLPLKRKGRNYWARCPFHQEKTPSFSVNADKQIYHCFGCHKGGNVFSFLMEYEKIPFPEALKQLAAKANIALPEKTVQRESKEIEQLHYAHEIALKFFHENLKESRSTLEYLKKRGIIDATIEKFKLGYALPGWDSLILHAHEKSLSDADLERAGLVVRSEKNTLYDRFRDRLIIPIFNMAQKPIAFGARTFNPNEQAKYINSPETPLYHKASVLYGLSHSRGEIRRQEQAIVVEGYFDYLSLHQCGVTNVVASSGTAFTTEQAQLLARSCGGVVLMFDSDSAGQAAAVRSVDILFEAGLDVRVVLLPKGEDPDSIARRGGRDAVLEQLARAQSYVEFSKAMLHAPFEKLPLHDRDRTIKRLTTLAGKIDDEIRRDLFLQDISRHYGIGIDLIRRGVKQVERRPSILPPRITRSAIDRDFLALLLQQPSYIDSAAEKIAPTDLEDTDLSEIYSLILLLRSEDQPVEPAAIIDKVDSAARKTLIAELAAHEFHHDELPQMYSDLVAAFHRRHREARISELKRSLQQAESEKNTDRIEFYLEEIRQLQREA